MASLGLEPYTHQAFGKTEGRAPRPEDPALFDMLLALEGARAIIVDEAWYAERHRDLPASGLSAVEHYMRFGEAEGRRPCAWFDPGWYRARNPDIPDGVSPLDHYILWGAAELRDPAPEFDAAFYVDRHPEAAGNPLMHHRLVGEARGYAVRREIAPALYMPSGAAATRPPPPLRPVSVIVPVYRGAEETRRCLESLLADPEHGTYRIVVVDDCTPDPALRMLLARVATAPGVKVVRNRENLGFVRSVNLGIALAGQDDVVLLNSDTIVPVNWVARLARHAGDDAAVASVSPVSNNATICSYPAVGANELAFGRSTAEIDAAMWRANAGRSVAAPTTVGFCMYIPRRALRALGGLDAEGFGRGYGEEVDFCRRAAAAGYANRIAWDVFVHHVGEVSFGAESPHRAAGEALVRTRYPDYHAAVARFVRVDEALPFRFAATAALFAADRRETRLVVAHRLGGGVKRHIDDLARARRGDTNIVVLSGEAGRLSLSFPLEPGHPPLDVDDEQLPSIARYLAAAGLATIEVHHTIGITHRIAELLVLLRPVPYRVVVHDYHLVCPQITLTQRPGDDYCGEPDAPACNACIAARGSRDEPDIDAWRLAGAALIHGAAEVVFPSRDAADRFARYFAMPAVAVVPHDTSDRWTDVRLPRLGPGEVLRVAVLGVLAEHKGSALALEVARRGPAQGIAVHLVGRMERHLEQAPEALQMTGAYAPAEIEALIARIDPHVVWFPARWPETYSYTLSEAVAARRAVVAPDIGAFPERLRGRPLSWLHPLGDTAGDVLGHLAAISAHCRAPSGPPPPPDAFLRRRPLGPAPRASGRGDGGGRRKALLIPERLDHGVPTPCAYIRQILPLRDLAGSLDLKLAIGSPSLVPVLDPEVLFLQRCSIGDAGLAAAVLDWAARRGCRVVYDLDDDLLRLPEDHPDAEVHRRQRPIVEMLLARADVVTVSTEPLAEAAVAFRREALVMPNALDGRLWLARPRPPRLPRDTVKLLYMGTATHAADLALVAPALSRLKARFGDRIAIDILGITESGLPEGTRRRASDGRLAHAYPGFVDWITRENDWDIGIAPLRGTAFDRAKSDIKVMDYAALGLCSVASDVPAYAGSIADGEGGILCGHDESAWYDALERLVRDPAFRGGLQAAGHARLRDRHLLERQKAERAAALATL